MSQTESSQTELSQTELAQPEHLKIQFWGVRGEIPTPGDAWLYYGGNTSCVEVRIGSHCLIFDGGSGLRALGQQLALEDFGQVHLFFTNAHWDRIQGFPFFRPAFLPKNRVAIYGPEAMTGASIKQQLMDQMRRPYSRVALWQMQAELSFQNLVPGSTVRVGEALKVQAFALQRREPVLGYRLTWGDRQIVYATAIALEEVGEDPTFWQMLEGADVLIYATRSSTPDAPPLSWQQGITLAQTAQVKRLIFCSHNPDHADATLIPLEQQIQDSHPQAHLAREGQALEITPS